MKNNKTGYIFLLAICIVTIFSCKKETPPAFQEDKKNPEIFFSSPAYVPMGQNQFVVSGTNLPIDIRFEDDVALSDYYISINLRGDVPYLKTHFDQWNPTRVGFLEGTSDGFNDMIYIADDPIGGTYEFQVTVFDKSGKSAQKTTYIYIKNKVDTIFPMVTITQPDPNSIQTFTIGNNLVVKAHVTDNLNVDDVTIRLRSVSSGSIIAPNQLVIDTLYSGNVNIDTFLVVDPLLVTPGQYDVEVIARDVYQNPFKKTSRIILQ